MAVTLAPEELFDKVAQKASEETGVPMFVIKGIASHESNFNPRAQAQTSSAYGYMQLLDGTARELGVDRYNPLENAIGGAKYFKQQLQRFGNVDLALAAYFRGPEYAQQLAAGQKSWEDTDTTGGNTVSGYVNDVKQRIRNYQQVMGQQQPQAQLPTTQREPTLLEPQEPGPMAEGTRTPMPQNVPTRAGATYDEPGMGRMGSRTPPEFAPQKRTEEGMPLLPMTPEEQTEYQQYVKQREQAPTEEQALERATAEFYSKTTPGMEKALVSGATGFVNALTYDVAKKAGIGESQAAQIAKSEHPWANIVGNFLGAAIPTVLTGAALNNLVMKSPAVIQALQTYGKGAQFALQSALRSAIAMPNSIVRNREGLISGDPELHRKAVANIFAATIGSALSPTPEGMRATWYRPIIEGVFDGALETGVMASFGQNAWDKENIAATVAQMIMSGAMGVAGLRHDVDANKIRATAKQSAIEGIKQQRETLGDIMMKPDVPPKEIMVAGPKEGRFETILPQRAEAEQVNLFTGKPEATVEGTPITRGIRPEPTEEQIAQLKSSEASLRSTEAKPSTEIEQVRQRIAESEPVGPQPEIPPPMVEPTGEIARVGGAIPSQQIKKQATQIISERPNMFKTGQQNEVLAQEVGAVRLPGGAPEGGRENVSQFAENIKKAASHWLSSKGDFPQEIFDANVKRQGRINNSLRNIERLTSDFYRNTEQAYGHSRLTDQEAFDIDATLKGQKPIGELPERVQPIVQSMRTEIDALTQAMIDEGLVEGPLAAVLLGNKGFYAARGYRVHTEPDWAKKVPAEVRNNAKAFIRDEHAVRSDNILSDIEMRMDELAGKKADLQARARVPDEMFKAPKIPYDEQIYAIDRRIDKLSARAQAIRAQKIMSDAELEGRINELLYKENAPMGILANKGKLGAKNLSMLKRRKEIPAQIRALWGEYKNADENYAMSVWKMSNALANHQFLNEAKAAGQGKYFFDKPVGEYYARISAEGNPSMKPLDGVYTTPEIKTAFEEAVSREVLPTWLKAYMKGIGVTKYGKTILSPMTHLRNTTGNVAFAIANGHYRIGEIPDAFKATFGDVMKVSPENLESEIKDLIGRGVLSDGARAGEMHAIIKDATQGDIDVLVGTGTRRRLQRAAKFGEKLYGAEDDVWKYYAFKNEMSRYRNAYPEMPENELRGKVAKIVRDTYPTYSMVPRAVKKLRRLPFVGTFVSFPAEVIRTGKNTIGLMVEELSNPATKKIGAERLAGILTMLSLPTAIAVGSRYLTGTTKEKEEAQRKFMPPWSENSQIVHTGTGDELKPNYIDLSYTDPYSYLRKPIIAFMRGENWKEKVIESGAELIEPFVSEDIFTSALLDISRNKTKNGQPVYNEQDPNWAADILDHILGAVEPGAIRGGVRIYKALQGEEGKAGAAYDAPTEIIAQSTGVRVTQGDITRSLKFKTYKFTRSVRDAKRLAQKRGEVVAEDQLNRLYDEFYDVVKAARIMGMTPYQIKKTLNESGLSEKNASAIVNGNYRKYTDIKEKKKTKPKRTAGIPDIRGQIRRDIRKSIGD